MGVAALLEEVDIPHHGEITAGGMIMAIVGVTEVVTVIVGMIVEIVEIVEVHMQEEMTEEEDLHRIRLEDLQVLHQEEVHLLKGTREEKDLWTEVLPQLDNKLFFKVNKEITSL